MSKKKKKLGEKNRPVTEKNKPGKESDEDVWNIQETELLPPHLKAAADFVQLQMMDMLLAAA